MNALIESLQQKVGLTAEQAKDAASHMMDFIKKKYLHPFTNTWMQPPIGDAIKTKSAEFLAGAQSKGSEFLHAAQDKISSLLHKEA